MHCHPHVFVAPGDVTRFAADAWLLPTDRTISVRDAWFRHLPTLRAALDGLGDRADAFRDETVRALLLPGWPETSPPPVLVAVPIDGVRDAQQVVEPLQEALHVAAEAARHQVDLRRATARRGLPLVALPLFGSAGGGGDQLRGEIIRTVLEVAGRVAVTEAIDVVLVLRKAADLAQAHALRRADPTTWQELDPLLVNQARDLAAHARNGRLVPFIGAGVSATAGLPLWKDLVQELSKDRLPDAERGDFAALDVLDQAHVLRELYDDRLAFTTAVARLTTADRYGLAPALLAGLSTREAVTLNYDDLYETAADSAGHKPAVLPQEVVGENGRWLLKLHGTVKDPSTIVLTREDYLGYGRGRAALSALAKAMLLTRHLLFVGFGLADDHFHELIYDVREVLPRDARRGRRLGTAVMLSTTALQGRMWGDDLDIVGIGGDDIPHQARRLEIFLDCLLAHADQGLSFFLDDRYRQRLTEPELLLRERLLTLARDASPEERGTPAWDVIADALESLGRK